MKKELYAGILGFLLFIPLYTHAEGGSLATLSVSPTKVKEVMEEATTTASTTKTFTECSQEAIEARDTRIAATRSVYNTAMANALTERKNKEKAAIAITDEDDKKDAIKASVDTYKNKVKAAQNTLTQARKTAWQSFEDDIVKCHDIQDDTTSGEEATSTNSLQKIEQVETKTIKSTLKAGIESIKSLFN